MSACMHADRVTDDIVLCSSRSSRGLLCIMAQKEKRDKQCIV